jgi:hypothetical protein
MLAQLRSALWRVHVLRYFLALPAWRLFYKYGPIKLTSRVSLDKITESLAAHSIYHDGTLLQLDSDLSDRVARVVNTPLVDLPFSDITESLDLADIVAVLKSVISTGVFRSLVEYYAGAFYIDKLQFVRTRATKFPSSSELWHRDCNDADSIHFVYCFSSAFVEPGFSIAKNSVNSFPNRLVDKIIVRRISDQRFKRVFRDLSVTVLDKPGHWLVFNPSRLWHKLHTRENSSVYFMLTFCSRQPFYPPSPLSPKVSRALQQALASDSGTAFLSHILPSIAFVNYEVNS